MLQRYMTKNKWPANMSKNDQHYFLTIANRVFQDKNKEVWWTSTTQESALPPREVLESSHVWQPLQHLWRTQCNSENLPENLYLLLLAQNVPRYQQTQKRLPGLPTKQEIHKQEDATSSSSHSRGPRSPDLSPLSRSTQIIGTNDHSRHEKKIVLCITDSKISKPSRTAS